MSLPAVATLAPLAASLTAWMLSGSPVPMVLSIFVLLASLPGGAVIAGRSDKARRIGRSLAPALIAGGAFFVELRLYSTGQALAVRADLPTAFHVGIGLLWWVTADIFVRLPQGRNSKPHRAGLTGIIGGLILLAASAATVRYDFGPWEIYPVAALPVVAFVAGALRPGFSFVQSLILAVLPATLAITALILASTAAADKLRPWLFPNEFNLADTDTSRASAPGGGSGLIDGASRHLPREADIRFNRQIVVHLKAHAPELFASWMKSPVYVRTSTLALFESDEVIAPIRSGRWLYDIDDGKEDNTIALESGVPVDASPYTVFISRGSVGHLPVLSNSSILFASAVYEFADDWYQLAPSGEITRLRYTAAAPSLPEAADIPAIDIERLRNQGAPGIYLNLPPSPLAARVTELTAGFDPKSPLEGIRDFLGKEATYSLQFTTPGDSSPVEEFLFGNRQGHCEHYAAATVMMLRSLGVPSRVAYGYAGGSADIGKQMIAFRDSDFHAWAEILTPDQNRWITFDTTPNVPASAPRAPGSAALPAMDETAYHDFSEFDPGSMRLERGFRERIAGLVALLSGHFFLTTAIGLGLIAGIWRLLPKRGRLEKRLPAAGRPGNSLTPFLPEFLRELELVAHTIGRVRKPGHTWREFFDSLADQPTVPSELDAAIAYYYGVCYSGKDRDPAMEKEFLLQIRQWHAVLRPD